MGKVLYLGAWIELILGFVGSVFFGIRDGLHITNFYLMLSWGLLLVAPFTYGIYYIGLSLAAKDKLRGNN
ncbi:hypothetical protein PASE110613_06840 [Paenibacillus sediminis]|uniref:Integral membrane protein n=1 Tax=Paenibacillus sediminis TaxID=664909 RepID=A0ABS4H2L3_9BACL|nr:hypothetical protein [Paenibacillus sediminis]MBP1936502.1 hypothetical protein [Paenibacillus sediminis]